MTEEQIIERQIRALEEELATAKKFLAIMKSRNPANVAENHAELFLNGAKPAYGQISVDVRAAIARCGQKFTVRDVEGSLLTIGKKIDRPTIARCINRLLVAKNPEIKIYKKGRGRKEARYRKVDMKLPQ